MDLLGLGKFILGKKKKKKELTKVVIPLARYNLPGLVSNLTFRVQYINFTEK